MSNAPSSATLAPLLLAQTAVPTTNHFVPPFVLSNPFLSPARMDPSQHTCSDVLAFNRSLMSIAWTDCSCPNHATAWIHKLLAMCCDFGLTDYHFLNHMIHAFGIGPPLDWLHATIPTVPRTSWTHDLFKAAFLIAFSGQVRDPHSVALDRMVDRQILQGTDTTHAYATRFLATSRLVPSITGAALCQYFICGLSPLLQSKCVLTTEGYPWSDINALIAHAHSAALHRDLISHLSDIPNLSPPSSFLQLYPISTPALACLGRRKPRQWKHSGKLSKIM